MERPQLSDIRVDWRPQRPAWSWFLWLERVTLAQVTRTGFITESQYKYIMQDLANRKGGPNA